MPLGNGIETIIFLRRSPAHSPPRMECTCCKASRSHHHRHPALNDSLFTVYRITFGFRLGTLKAPLMSKLHQTSTQNKLSLFIDDCLSGSCRIEMFKPPNISSLLELLQCYREARSSLASRFWHHAESQCGVAENCVSSVMLNFYQSTFILPVRSQITRVSGLDSRKQGTLFSNRKHKCTIINPEQTKR